MVKFFQKRFALSEDGAKNLKSAVIWDALLNISYILPALLALVFLNDYVNLVWLQGLEPKFTLWQYIGASVVIAVIIWVFAYIDYDRTYSKIYGESANTRIKLAETLRKLPLAFFGQKDLSDLTSTVMDDVTQFEQIFSHSIPQLFGSAISGIVFIICLFFYDWQMSLALAWVIPVALLIFYSAKSFVRKLNLGELDAKLKVSDKIQEGLDRAQEIKSYNQEANYVKELNSDVDILERAKHKSNLTALFMGLSNFTLKLGLPSVIITGAYLLANGTIDIFAYLVFLVLVGKVYDPFIEIISNSAVLAYLDTRIDRIKDMQNMPYQDGTTEFNPKNSDIEFKNVYFSYQKGGHTIKNASFIAKQGEVTALIGPSGGGKSTLAKLAARFWDIDKGQILLGGEDIAKIDPETLLKQFSIVFQDVTLFNASIMDNIRLGRQDASDDEVKRVAKLARCEEFIEKLPDGYDTLIGENGEKLSGGERQRISIARALLKDAPIILLDEATASLDAENETQIQKAISELVKNKSVLIIAHRMRTVARADKIVAVKDGEIVEIGTPEELKHKGGIFANMLAMQMGK